MMHVKKRRSVMAKQFNYKNKVGDEVRIAFLDGKMLVGKSIDIYRYDLLLKQRLKKMMKSLQKLLFSNMQSNTCTKLT